MSLHLGAVYLNVRDFDKRVVFYEKLLAMPVTRKLTQRFASFLFDTYNISLMNTQFDAQNPGKVIHMGEFTPEFDALDIIAENVNSHSFVFNFWADDLRLKRERIAALGISPKLTKVKFVHNTSPYYYFQLTDPDDNILEVTGQYVPENGEFAE